MAIIEKLLAFIWSILVSLFLASGLWTAIENALIVAGGAFLTALAASVSTLHVPALEAYIIGALITMAGRLLNKLAAKLFPPPPPTPTPPSS